SRVSLFQSIHVPIVCGFFFGFRARPWKLDSGYRRRNGVRGGYVPSGAAFLRDFRTRVLQQPAAFLSAGGWQTGPDLTPIEKFLLPPGRATRPGSPVIPTSRVKGTGEPGSADDCVVHLVGNSVQESINAVF